MVERAGVFEEDFEVSSFAPKKPAKREEPEPEAVRAVSESVSFKSREPAPKTPRKPDRRYRTGRNIPLATKISARARDLLYGIHDERRDSDGNPEWTIGEIIEFGLEAFKKELEAQKAEG